MSFLTKTINTLSGGYFFNDPELTQKQEREEVKMHIMKNGKKFIEEKKLNNIELKIHEKSLDKFMNAIKKILSLNNKEFKHVNVMNFLIENTEFAFHGTRKELVDDILENGWSPSKCINKNSVSFEIEDYFTNKIDTAHQFGNKGSVVIFALIIKPDFSGKYNNVSKIFLDNFYCEKAKYLLKNTESENYSLGLGVISTQEKVYKGFYDSILEKKDYNVI